MNIRIFIGRWAAAIKTTATRMEQSWASNLRLRLLLIATALILSAEGGLRWIDLIGERMNTRSALRAEMVQLQQQTREPDLLRNDLLSAQRLHAHAIKRLLHVRSEAHAQARLQDWLNQLVQKNGLQLMAINVGMARSLGGASPAGSDKKTAEKSVDMQINASLVIRLTPDALNAALQEIESSEWIMRVETLSIRRLDRRIEIGIVMPIRIESSGA